MKTKRGFWIVYVFSLLTLPWLTTSALAGETVQLSWTANQEADVVGYNVLRSGPASASFARLNSTPLPATTFLDPELDAGVYRYVVTAVSGNGLESEYSDEVVVEVEDVEEQANHLPIARDDRYSLQEDRESLLNALLNDSDEDGDPLVVAEFGQGRHGKVSLQGSLLSYRPDADFVGADDFGYVIDDGRGGRAEGHVFVTVASVNDSPQAFDDEAEGREDESVTIAVLGNDLDPDGDRLAIVQTTRAEHGVIFVRNQATLRYQPDLDYFGPDSFKYVVEDPAGLRSQAQVRLDILPVNDAPSVDAGDNLVAEFGDHVTLEAQASDPDEDELTYVWTLIEGPEIELENPHQSRAAFLVPDLGEPSQWVFEVVVSDGQTESSDRIEVAVRAYDLLLFPADIHLEGDDESDNAIVGVALVNPGGEEDAVSLMGVDSDGHFVTEDLGTNLQSGAQRVFVTRDLSDSIRQASVLMARSQRGTVQGFFMTGDAETSLEGIGGRLEDSRQLYLPAVRVSGPVQTAISLLNPNRLEEATVRLKLISAEGIQLAERELVLPGLGSIRRRASDLFPDIELEDGFIRVDSDRPVRGFQLNRSDESLTSLPAMTARPASRLMIPHFFRDDEGGDTEIRLLNPSETPLRVVVRAFADQGEVLAVSRREIAAGSVLALRILDLLAEVQPAQTTRSLAKLEVEGFLEVEVDEEKPRPLVGVVTFTANLGRIATSVPMARRATEKQIFLHLAQSQEHGLFTGLAILNPQDAPALVTFEAFDGSGRKTAERTVEIAARSRLVDLLDGDRLFGAEFSQIAGHLGISSSLPVVGCALFGDYEGEYLAAIEPQETPRVFE